MKKYDAIVIGSGQAGTPLCKKLADSGMKTALIEKRWVGGTCVNDGCSPTKAMVASAKAAWSAQHNKKLGVHVNDVKINLQEILSRKNEIVHSMRGNSEKAIGKTKNLDLIYGEASFIDKNTVLVKLNDGSEEQVIGEKFFINTGAAPSVPDIEGISEIEYLNSTTILDIKEIPEHLLVVGGGYIGLEFGQMFRRFGSKVTIVVPSERLLPKEDADIAEEMKKIFELENIAFELESKVKAVSKSANGIIAKVESKGKSRNISCSHILLATGRVPQTQGLNLKSAGIETDEKGYITVNNKLETSVKGVYALGDVKGGPAFTHISFDDYRIVRKNLLEKGKETITNRLVPYCMFTDPQLGRIGITEQEAKKQGLDVKIATISNNAVARSIETGDERGMMKAVVDSKTGKILGASVLAEQGGEIASLLQIAMMGGVDYEELRDAVFAHPTYSESINNLFMTIES